MVCSLRNDALHKAADTTSEYHQYLCKLSHTFADLVTFFLSHCSQTLFLVGVIPFVSEINTVFSDTVCKWR